MSILSTSDLLIDLADELTKENKMLATAESCTGGGVAAFLTSYPGCSQWFDRGFITYSNESKMECLGVPEDIIAKHGAVSEECARAMALGVLNNSNAAISLVTTGIAGPGGGSEEKPIGLVWFSVALSMPNANPVVHAQSANFKGNRHQIQAKAVEFGCQYLRLLF